MERLEELVNLLVGSLDKKIPIGISNRHIHLSQADINTLFGENYELTKLKDLSQEGQYAAKEVVTICGPKGAIEKIRVLGPARKESQVELSIGDCIKAGIKAEIRQSGDLKDTPGVVIVGPKGAVNLERGVIVSQRHIHMNEEDAKKQNVCDGEVVSLKIDGLRGGILNNVIVRVHKSFKLECHLDIEEANGLGLNPKSKVEIVK